VNRDGETLGGREEEVRIGLGSAHLVARNHRHGIADPEHGKRAARGLQATTGKMA
jgi:hypothetical protein